MKPLKAPTKCEEQLELFAVIKIFPKRTEPAAITGHCLRLLVQGEMLTDEGFKAEAGWCLHVGCVIRKLQKKGWPIQKTDAPRSDGRRGKVRVYFLDRQLLSAMRGKGDDG